MLELLPPFSAGVKSALFFTSNKKVGVGAEYFDGEIATTEGDCHRCFVARYLINFSGVNQVRSVAALKLSVRF